MWQLERTISGNNVELCCVEASKQSSGSVGPFLRVGDVFNGVLRLFDDLSLGSAVIGDKTE